MVFMPHQTCKNNNEKDSECHSNSHDIYHDEEHAHVRHRHGGGHGSPIPYHEHQIEDFQTLLGCATDHLSVAHDTRNI